MNYTDLWKTWLEAREQNPPEGIAPLREHKGYTKPYFLMPEDMMKVLNAFSPYDLYNNPDTTPPLIDYSTSAFNIKNLPGGLGIENAILLASQNPKSQLSPIHSVSEEQKLGYADIPQELLKYVAQGIYEHEYGHEKDPRLLPQGKNYGFLIRYGLPGNIAGRETPAIRQEDMFWDYIMNEGIKRMK